MLGKGNAAPLESWRPSPVVTSSHLNHIHKVFLWNYHGTYMDCFIPNPVYGHFWGGGSVKGKNVREVLPKPAAQVILQGISRVLKQNSPSIEEFEIERLEGRVLIKGQLIPTGEMVLGLITDCPDSSAQFLADPTRSLKNNLNGNMHTSDLTPQEEAVIEEVKHARTNRGIAQELKISEGTVKFHLKNIFRKKCPIALAGCLNLAFYRSFIDNLLAPP